MLNYLKKALLITNKHLKQSLQAFIKVLNYETLQNNPFLRRPQERKNTAPSYIPFNTYWAHLNFPTVHNVHLSMELQDWRHPPPMQQTHLI